MDCHALLPTLQWVVTSSAPRVAETLIAKNKRIATDLASINAMAEALRSIAFECSHGSYADVGRIGITAKDALRLSPPASSLVAPGWDVKVMRRGAYRRCVFRVGVQHFTIASGSDGEARQHVHFIKKMFLQALARLGVTPREAP